MVPTPPVPAAPVYSQCSRGRLARPAWAVAWALGPLGLRALRGVRPVRTGTNAYGAVKKAGVTVATRQCGRAPSQPCGAGCTVEYVLVLYASVENRGPTKRIKRNASETYCL